MSRLLLMRHGKAAFPDGVEDFERPLADRGRREAALAGEWIREHVGTVDVVLCSTSTRTRETLAATGLEAPARFLDEIYEGWTGSLLEAIQSVDDAASTVLLVGHAPGTPGLAARLAGEDSDPDALHTVRAGFPTSAIAVLDVAGPWAALEVGTATLTDVVIPR
ncbi:histidine phosphatase family protein [Aeromicrobium sp. Marseille-Q0843]|uniref:Histidine phosphatase family protein n=1 Tax=Aeromicrobium phoceense TaxID=2754045 RepID=A0A838XFQ8_9ACTN|nr:histidine phosphatase family protein [Aeromicrobium phoceense]MBA4607761.1 histidine phosphatase family protein [Aeromicrobium phoceense]